MAKRQDTNELAAMIAGIATGDIEKPAAPDTAAVKRGKARADKLSPAERTAIAKKGAKARWSKGK